MFQVYIKKIQVMQEKFLEAFACKEMKEMVSCVQGPGLFPRLPLPPPAPRGLTELLPKATFSWEG